jgi:hypothetical protein
MSSQALKMKKNLEKIRRDRKIFEEKKSQLDAEMTKGRVNMSKIKSGLRNNEITDSPIEVAAVITGSSSLGSSFKLPLNHRKSKSSVSDQNNKSPSSQLAEQSSGMFSTVSATIYYHKSDYLKSFLCS